MIMLTNENPENTPGASLSAIFTQALAEVPAEQLLADDVQLSAPSAPAPPLTTTTAPESPVVPPPVPPTATPAVATEPSTPPTPTEPTAPPPEPAPLAPVMRQVQELTGLLSQATPEAAEEFWATLAEVNEPLALELANKLNQYVGSQGQPNQPAQPPIPVELPPTKFDFEKKSADDYDEQTWGDFQAAKEDIDAARQTATEAQRQVAQLQQQLAELKAAQPAQPAQPPSSETYINERAETIKNALAAVPAIAEDPTKYRIVHNSVLAELQSSAEFAQGVQAAKAGNQLAAYQLGLLVDQAINNHVAEVVKTLLPAPAPPAPPATPPAPLPTIPEGSPAKSTAIPPVTPTPGATFVDGLLTQLQQLEQTNAVPWLAQYQ